MSPAVVSLQLHGRHGEHPRAVDRVTGRVGGGIEGDSHADHPSRSVVVVDRATLDALGLAPGDLREQITIAGLPDVTSLGVGTKLRIGGVTLRVNGPCEPCTHIGEMIGVADVEEFRLSLVGRRGALCTVLVAETPIHVGDPVEILIR